MFKKIDHIEIVPSDIDKTINFYTETLGFKIQRRWKIEASPLEEVAFLELNGSVIELFSIKGPAAMSTEQWQVGCRRIALEVEDMEKAVEYLKARGVAVSQGAGSSKRAEIKDPDGLSIELLQRG